MSRSGTEARVAFGEQIPVAYDGPYSQGYAYDVCGNRTHIEGWGGAARWADYTYTNNRRNGMQYDAAGNITNDGGQNFSYDATGQQATASYSGYSLQQGYDGDGRRAKKNDNGDTVYYLRSTVLGGQVTAEINGSGTWVRGYVYSGASLLAVQQNNSVNWVHEDPVAKSKRVTDINGNVVSAIELDPFGGDTSRSSNSAFQPKTFTSYHRDANASDDAMFRRHNRWWAAFDQPDPYDGSYDFTDPQSFNRYSYTQNDPVNFADPTGLLKICFWTVTRNAEGFEDGIALEQCIDLGPIGLIPGTAGGGGGSGPEPEPPPPTPTTEDPCDPKYASEVERDLKQIAAIIGGKLDPKWKLQVGRSVSVEAAVGRLQNAGFVQFRSYNPTHLGANLQGQINSRWYHVTVSPVSAPNAAVNSNRIAPGKNDAMNARAKKSSTPIREVTAHCETHKPDSWAHAWDYLKSWFW